MSPLSGMDQSESGGGGGVCEVCVVRPSLNITQRASKYHYCPPPDPGLLESLRTKVKETCSCSGGCVVSAVKARVPILSWLPNYDVRSSLLGDVVAGVTVAIMNIPVGMGYVLLGDMPPITGIYMAFFPVLIYALLGTARHSSIGSFGVVCLMTGKVLDEFIAAQTASTIPPLVGNITNDLPPSTTRIYTRMEVATVLALMNGIVEIVLGLLKLGSLCVYLSDMLVSGFTTGAAFHILASQVPSLLGIKIQSYNGPLKVIYAFRDIISQLLSSNPAVMTISGVTFAVLIFNNIFIKPWVGKKTKIPIPIELIVVVAGTLVSYLGDLHHTFNIQILGEIPTGLPEPTAPPFELMSVLAVDSVIISIVAYMLSLSMAKIFAQKHNYNVDATQELYAMGASNIFGSFFSCSPICASLARSLIQEAVGGVTQLTSIICCGLLLFVLLYVGPAFETLPNCVLSAVIIVALRGMFLQVNDLRKVWAASRVDALIWIATFLGVLIIDIDYGLLLGIAVSLVVLLGRSQQPRTARLGRVPDTDVYLDVNKYSATVELSAVSIFQFNGPLHFANCDYFRQQLISTTGLEPVAIAASKALQEHQRHLDDLNTNHTMEINGSVAEDGKKINKKFSFLKRKSTLKISKQDETLALPQVQWLVIEMSGVSYTDSTGGNLLSQLSKEYKQAGITLCLAALSESALETLEECGTLKEIPPEYIFHSAHDAVKTLTQADVLAVPAAAAAPDAQVTCTKF